ncbi:helix-turn-helix domain-containing protein [Staphylococcus equorum]|uniref:helix-turn-helix domain-containing protein n=1 Tax=Staphylococcus equorum TaxID=246432 RepID=UPI0024088F88|nr:helix-turn-helix transcriptional regulator [Staphylococcus equorum]MDG0822630.1 helix-turn-helix domain-containing protein [Staphylococcus equorum]
MILGEQIKKHRVLLGMTQEDLSQHLHTTRQTVSKWEKDTVEPDINMLLKLSRLFKISLDTLITGETVKKVKEKPNVMNVWAFLSEKWWLVIIIVVIICGSVAQVFS